jgi:hypothetical protein
VPAVAEKARAGQTYDVLVFGDSISSPAQGDPPVHEGGYWTDFLAAETGLSVGVFHDLWFGLVRYVESSSFRDHPPRVVVLEVIERLLVGLGDPAPAECPALSPMASGGPASSPPALHPVGVNRETATRFDGTTLDQAIDYLNKNVPRWLFRKDRTEVVGKALVRDDLFTSRRAGDLLFFYDDVKKANWSPALWDRIGCQLRMIQAKVEANGQTRFVVLIAPDKSSAYRPFLKDASALPNALERLATIPNLHLPRLDQSLAAGIVSGRKDVYLPNDTHWGHAGAQIAACTVRAFLGWSSPQQPSGVNCGAHT